MLEWCAFGLRPCWTREEWIALWASFGGVFLAFLLGVTTQKWSEQRKSKAAYKFLESALLSSNDAISYFDDAFRKIGTEEQIGKGFGGLAHAAATIRWASSHPEKFDPNLFVRLLMVEERIDSGSDVGPSSFAGSNFVIDASTYLARTIPPVADDIRFLLGLNLPKSEA